MINLPMTLWRVVAVVTILWLGLAIYFRQWDTVILMIVGFVIGRIWRYVEDRR